MSDYVWRFGGGGLEQGWTGEVWMEEIIGREGLKVRARLLKPESDVIVLTKLAVAMVMIGSPTEISRKRKRRRRREKMKMTMTMEKRSSLPPETWPMSWRRVSVQRAHRNRQKRGVTASIAVGRGIGRPMMTFVFASSGRNRRGRGEREDENAERERTSRVPYRYDTSLRRRLFCAE